MSKKIISDIFFFVSLVCVLLTTTACTSQMPEITPEPVVTPAQMIAPEPAGNTDVWIRTGVDELAHMATDIIRAEVLSSREELINTLLSDIELDPEIAETFIKCHIVYELRVIEVFKGDTAVDDVVEIMQEIENGSYLQHLIINIGDDLIFFLRCFEKEGFRHLPMAIEAGNQGVYKIDGSDIELFQEGIKEKYKYYPSLSSVSLISLCEYNTIALTVGDLMHLADIFNKNEDALNENKLPPEWFDVLEGQEMTLDDVRELAAKGYDLQIEDFLSFQGINDLFHDPSYGDKYLMIFNVQYGHQLSVGARPDGGIDIVNFICAEQLSQSLHLGIEIRAGEVGDIDKYLQDYCS